ncbi:hypothetical protein AUTU_42820 (plasmid) [Aureibacter tunicatorum]|nr:hypothetical protein AUTU_42820 [Aureibacter tunicatorum]
MNKNESIISRIHWKLLSLIISSLFIITSCDNNKNINYSESETFFNIFNSNHDHYLFEYNFILKNKGIKYAFFGHGELEYKKDCYIITIEKLGINKEVLFNFNSSIGSFNSIKFNFNNLIFELPIKLENVYMRGDEKIYKFRLIKSYYYYTDEYDQILFASPQKGFIGGYLFDNKNSNYLISKRGDILEDLIDYTNYSYRVLK